MGVFLFICAVSAPAAHAVAAGSGRIEGSVSAEGSAPLTGVWVCAYLAQSEEFEEHCDFTGSDGIYAIQGLKADNYKVEFWSEATEPSYVGEFYDDEEFWEEADEVEVAEGVTTTGIDAELALGATIKGEVRAASLGGPLGYAAAVVCAHRPSGEPVGCAMTRSDGTYVLPGLPAGEYKTQFVPASNIYNLLNQSYDHKRMWTEADAIDVGAGETKTGIDADLEPGSEIQGTVYSASSGSPVADVSVCALFYEAIFWEAWLPAHCVPTSSSGTYRLFALWSDDYRVVFSADFNEIFGEGPHREDGYFAQYFDRKPTLAAADPLPLDAPEVMTGIDGHLQPKPTASIATPLVTTPAIALPKRSRRVPLRCRPGFRKKRVGGKKRCVKVHKHQRHHRKHGKS